MSRNKVCIFSPLSVTFHIFGIGIKWHQWHSRIKILWFRHDVTALHVVMVRDVVTAYNKRLWITVLQLFSRVKYLYQVWWMSTKWFEIESTYYDDLKNLECLLSTKENRL